MPTLVLFYNKKWYSIYIGNRDYLTNLKIKGGIEMSVVTTVQKEIESLKNSIKREKAIESNIFDMTAVIEHIAELKEASEPMAEESPYESYEEWQAAAEKGAKGISKLIGNNSREQGDISGIGDLYIRTS